jgi:hypothetical protein
LLVRGFSFPSSTKPKDFPMSHIVSIATKLRDPAAIAAACQRLGLAAPEHGSLQLFAGQGATGWAVRLPDWRYPAVIDLATGEVQFDNFGGHWGDARQLDRFVQAYAVEKAKLEARKQGHSVSEQLLADGSIQVRIQTAA